MLATVASAILHKILSFVQLAWEALKDTAWGFNPAHLANAYLQGDALGRLLTGVAAIAVTLAAIIGVPHIIVNTILLLRDLKRSGRRLSILAFIERQDQAQVAYLATLSDAEAEALGEKTEFSEADTREVEALLKVIRAKDRHWMERFEGFWSGSHRHQIRTLPDALLHFFFSFASMTNSAVLYSRVWNVWFGLRTFFPLFHPVLFLTVLLYPSFFGTATSRFKKDTLPSNWNGGLRSLPVMLYLCLFRCATYRRLRELERALIPGEALIHAASLQAAEAIHLRRRGIYRVSFLRTVDAIQAAAMAKWLGLGAMSVDARKLELLKEQVDLSLDVKQADSLVASVKGEAVSAAGLVWDFFRALKYSVQSTISPVTCRQIEIIQVTERQFDNAKAMARAVRSMLASNLVDKPQEIVFILICYAGITEGILKPLHVEMFSENSWFYLSRYVFLNVFIYSVIAGIFSDTWLKIQQDTMNEGRFENAPQGEDVHHGYTAWLFRKMFFNSENTWWHNQKFTVLHYILPTLKATFVTALIVNFITLGRLDLDSFTANSLVLIFLPFTGLSWKLEQGFELASAWVVRDVPSRLRPHPLVQKYALQAIAKRRISFNIYYKIYENVTWNFLGAFMNMNTLLFGTRSFSRLVFFGFTPTELFANSVRSLHTAALGISPILAWPLSALDSLLTHGYTDGTKLGKDGWGD